MRAAFTRLGKLEERLLAAAEPVTHRPTCTDFGDLIETIRERTAWFATASALDQVRRLGEEVRSHTSRPSATVAIDFSDMRNELFAELQAAELELLAELGYPNSTHPIPPEHRVIIDSAVFED